MFHLYKKYLDPRFDKRPNAFNFCDLMPTLKLKKTEKTLNVDLQIKFMIQGGFLEHLYFFAIIYSVSHAFLSTSVIIHLFALHVLIV